MELVQTGHSSNSWTLVDAGEIPGGATPPPNPPLPPVFTTWDDLMKAWCRFPPAASSSSILSDEETDTKLSTSIHGTRRWGRGKKNGPFPPPTSLPSRHSLPTPSVFLRTRPAKSKGEAQKTTSPRRNQGRWEVNWGGEARKNCYPEGGGQPEAFRDCCGCRGKD